MAVGKTTVAKQLASALGLQWLDLDAEIEAAAQLPIADIFAARGEESFRALERSVLQQVTGALSEPHVIATGGGVVEGPSNWDALRRLGVVVWLHAPLEALRARIVSSDRPLADDDLSARYVRRIPLYAQADAVVLASEGDVDGTAADVARAVHEARAARAVHVQAPSRAYDVYVGQDGVAHAAKWLLQQLPPQVLLVRDAAVPEEHARRLHAALDSAGVPTSAHVLRGGESNKGLTALESIWDSILSHGADRKTVVVALGGGVTGDMAGFAAATALRGLRIVHIATTLLSMVDSSVGGKTAINHRQGKNLVGAFHQPSLVCCALETLSSLPDDEIRAGWAEVIKVAVTHDKALFERLEGVDFSAPQAVDIAAAVALKAEVVRLDEREAGARKVLNFGHTVGHAIERATSYARFKHGEAVALGMVAALELSMAQGVCPRGDAERVIALLRAVPLPVKWPEGLAAGAVREALGHDKKTARRGAAAGVDFIRCLGLGSADVAWVSLSEVPLSSPSLLDQRG